MKKWELARYLLDDKKSIDTLLYVAENSEDVSMIDMQKDSFTQPNMQWSLNQKKNTIHAFYIIC